MGWQSRPATFSSVLRFALCGWASQEAVFSPPLWAFLVNTPLLALRCDQCRLGAVGPVQLTHDHSLHPPPLALNSSRHPGTSVTVQRSPSSVSLRFSICRLPHRSQTNSRVIRIAFSCQACRPCFATKLVRSRYYRPVSALNLFFIPFLPLCVIHMLIMLLKHLYVYYHIVHNGQNVYAIARGIECGEPTGNAVAQFDRTGRYKLGASCVRL